MFKALTSRCGTKRVHAAPKEVGEQHEAARASRVGSATPLLLFPLRLLMDLLHLMVPREQGGAAPRGPPLKNRHLRPYQ